MDISRRPDIGDDLVEETPGISRAERVATAVTAWKAQLVDVGGRNTLLYYRDLRQGTLDLGEDGGADPVAVDDVLTSRTVSISTIFRDPEALLAAAKRARTIKSKAREMFEERGLRTLHLAWGMATWENRTGAAMPAAPVILRQADLVARGGAEEDFALALTDEYEINPTLLHFLRQEFGVDLDGEELMRQLEESTVGPPDPASVFETIAKAASSVAGFGITSRLVLGNFSYTKLPMVKDLETSLEALISSDLIAAIAGDPDARRALRERQPSDVQEDDPDRVPLADEFLVLDADSSQNYVINAAIRGADLVVEGPPGTGKSQTIANLIASLAARGNSVLFVAEKRAAIDAVTRRLADRGLADLVLDLHEGAGSKRRLAGELDRTMKRIAGVLPVDTSELSKVERRRAELDAYVKALHRIREPWDITFFDARSASVGVPDHLRTDFRWRDSHLRAIDAMSFASLQEGVERFVSQGGSRLLTDETSSAWRHAARARSITTSQLAVEAHQTARALASNSLPRALRLLNEAAEATGREPASSLDGWSDAITLWAAAAASLREWDPSVFDLDLPQVVEAMKPAGAGAASRALSLLFARGYRRMRASLKRLARGEKMSTPRLRAAAIAAKDVATAWATVSAAGTKPGSPDNLEAVTATLEQTQREADRLSVLASIHASAMRTPDLLDFTEDLVADTATVNQLPALTMLQAAFDNAGALPLVTEIGARSLSADEATVTVEYAWCSSIHEHIFANDAVLSSFRRETHDRNVDRYTAGDDLHISSTPHRVLRAVAERSIEARNSFPLEDELVRKQLKLKRRHTPIRDLFQAAPHVLKGLKPCWAMSPLVVAQLLPGDHAVFDVVIFDEASQITPADAVGPLMRAKQAIVAGDRRQLPPTSFFLTASEDGEEDSVADASVVSNIESVLDVMAVVLPAPQGTRTLGWHYRSRDERLIAFSNAQPSLYDWSLTTFPGVTEGGCLEHLRVDGESSTTTDGDSPSAEVLAVVDRILQHAVERPDETLGVIAMGIKHAERIAEMLRRTRSDRPDLDEFFAEDREEPFFVKNLERVQGDERDAIILSVGYGKSADGRMYYRFGPINMLGGERRLNVAVTRAKKRVTVVSSFSSSDLDPGRLRSEGAQMLRRYLEYAESGGENLGRLAMTRPELNPFERDVMNHLTAAGIPLIAQYGVSGYFIDFVASHPVEHGRMVLAIEADGAMYHSATTVRDRDRLRQQHLERLGWRFHRIWSTEWFLHREEEIQRALRAYEDAVNTRPGPRRLAPIQPAPGPRVGAPRPTVPRGLGIGDYSDRQLAAIVAWIRSDGLPRTDEDLLQTAMRDLGFERRGSRIVERLTDAIASTR